MADPYSGPPLRCRTYSARYTPASGRPPAGDGGGAAAHRLDKAALRDGGHRGVADGPHGGGGGAGHLHLYRRLGEEPKVKSHRFVQAEEAEEAEPDEEALVTLLRTVHSCW